MRYLTVADVDRHAAERRQRDARSRTAADELARRATAYLRGEKPDDGCVCDRCKVRRDMRTALANYLRTE